MNYNYKYELLLIVIFLILIQYIFFNSFRISKNYLFNESIDKRILSLRKQYKFMIKTNRITLELCNDEDKLGKNRTNIYSIGNNCEPWISRECIFVLDHILSHNAIGLEWSTGSSTIWLGYRIKSLISIENTPNWANTVRNVTYRLNLHNKISIHYISPDKIDLCKNDSKFISSNKLCYKTYVTSNKIDNKEYDYISVDGRARNGCILRAIKLIKQNNGILVLDNSERKNYQSAINKIPKKWSRFDYSYSNGIVTIWITHSG